MKKKLFACVLIIMLMLGGLPDIYAQGDLRTRKTVSYFSPGDEEIYKKAYTLIQNEFKVLVNDELDVIFNPLQHAAWDRSTADELVKGALADQSVDLIVISGSMMAEAVRDAGPLPKPVVIADLIEPRLLGFAKTEDSTTGLQNLYYIAKDKTAEDEMREFHSMLRFDTLHVLVDQKYDAYAQKVINNLGKVDFDVKLISVPSSIPVILERIHDENIEALMLTRFLLSREEKVQLITELNNRKIPTYSLNGYVDVDDGVLLSTMPRFHTKFARRMAMSIQRILRGERPEDISTRFDLEYKPVINLETARLLDINFPFDVLLNAEVLHADATTGDELTLHKAVDESLLNNWSFRIAEETIKVSQKDHLLQWSNYLPTVEGRLTYDVYDSERANNPSGATPKEDFRIGARLDQLIFSDPVIKDIANASKQVKIERLKKDSTTLDITNRTVKAYLQYLRAKALGVVEMSNMTAIEEQRKVAEKRQDVGKAGPEEVLRWNAELAEKKSDVVRQSADIHKARVTINQLMNHELEQVFTEQDVGLETIKYYIGSMYLDDYAKNLNTILVLLDLFQKEALKNSPEVQVLDFAIEQQENLLKAADGRFILPEARFTGDLDHTIDDKYYSTPPKNDHDDWNIGFEITYPLFDGGRRFINSFRERDALRRVKFKKILKEQEIERDLRRAAYDLHYSYLSIDLLKQAMTNSTENYNIVVKKYDEGLASITDLINARNDKYRREGNAVVAVYNFLFDLSTFDKSMSQFMMLASEEDRQLWLDRVKEYLDMKGVI